MNGIISSESLDVDVLKKTLSDVPSMEGLELSSQVTTQEAYFMGNPEARYKLAVMDYGCKRNILRNFVDRDCYVKVFNAKTMVALGFK